MQFLRSWMSGFQTLEETNEIVQHRRVQELPLLLAAKENNIERLKELLVNEACDPLQRGAQGETALHVAVTHNNMEAAQVLIQEAPALVHQPMTSDLYQGQVALHIAAVNQNVGLVKLLIESGADVSSPRATGTFFSLNPKNLFYFGNTVLHILILQPSENLSCQMLDFILSQELQDAKQSLCQIRNKQGLSPLMLAAAEGNMAMFQHLVQKQRKAQWAFGPVTTMLYDLSEIDSWEKDQSVLEIIATSRKSQASNILNCQPVKELLKEKWKRRGRPYLLSLAALYLLYMICVSLCCANRPLKPREGNITNPRDITLFVQKTLEESYITEEDHLRLVGEIISVIGALILLLLEISQVFRVGIKVYVCRQMWENPFHFMRFSYSLMVLATLSLRVSSSDGEEIPMAMALVSGWCYMMYFAQGFQMLGPFTIIIQKLAASDLLKYCWLMALVIWGYSTALYIAYQTEDPSQLGGFFPYTTCLLSTYELFLNILNGPANYAIDVPGMYTPLYGSFCVIAFLLMFNLLTALMGDTQGDLAKQKDELWRAQIADTTVMMERRIPRCFWSSCGPTDRDMEGRRYLSVEERKWLPLPPTELNGYQEDSDEETDDEDRNTSPWTEPQWPHGSPEANDSIRIIPQGEHRLVGEEVYHI
ncbi:transient receptor potential cation channel subfamily V member 6 isoform X2 [Xenopus tropicalis]|uniref:Transient receptor potential cation channel subfamily V member 6 isoform X2 n=1 Tax=Xenopus tropicalis TaxID=8364 RepID=A0A8J1JVB2_XENTR|nr:transient receptor potential cation channel subfamily V member 6 isoform X2 [Xenopus tropicalis]